MVFGWVLFCFVFFLSGVGLCYVGLVSECLGFIWVGFPREAWENKNPEKQRTREAKKLRKSSSRRRRRRRRRQAKKPGKAEKQRRRETAIKRHIPKREKETPSTNSPRTSRTNFPSSSNIETHGDLGIQHFKKTPCNQSYTSKQLLGPPTIGLSIAFRAMPAKVANGLLALNNQIAWLE